MTATASKERRRLHYDSLNEVKADAEQLAAGGYETVGNWSYGQILNHLTKHMNYSIDGFPGLAPWPVRFIGSRFMKKKALKGPMKPGFQLPKKAAPLMPDENVPDETAALEGFTTAIDRFQSETPRAVHPLFGKLTPEEWVQLHQRHAELHMSFVRPAGA